MTAAITSLALTLHVAAGTAALLTGAVALSARKGGRAHRAWGITFVVCMLVMAALANYLAVAMPDQIPNLFVGTLTIYFVSTAWLTVRRTGPQSVGIAEKVAFLVVLSLFLPFALLSLQASVGIRPFFNSAVPLEGPVRIAIYAFTSLTGLATIGDARLIRAGQITGAKRIARHLWRMCLGLAFAAGSAFTNGLPRLLPDTVRVPLIALFMPQLFALAVLVYWLARVRFTGWYANLVRAVESGGLPHEATTPGSK